MLAHQLQAAERPALTLALVGRERIGQEPIAIAAIGVMREPSAGENGDAEIAVLHDGVARPAADAIERVPPDQAHRAVHDNGIDLVALDHADIEEPGIFGVHGVMHNRAIAVAVILRRLHQPNLRIGKLRNQIFEPVRLDHIVGVDHADDLGVRCRVRQRHPQCSGFEAVKSCRRE